MEKTKKDAEHILLNPQFLAKDEERWEWQTHIRGQLNQHDHARVCLCCNPLWGLITWTWRYRYCINWGTSHVPTRTQVIGMIKSVPSLYGVSFVVAVACRLTIKGNAVHRINNCWGWWCLSKQTGTGNGPLDCRRMAPTILKSYSRDDITNIMVYEPVCRILDLRCPSSFIPSSSSYLLGFQPPLFFRLLGWGPSFLLFKRIYVVVDEGSCGSAAIGLESPPSRVVGVVVLWELILLQADRELRSFFLFLSDDEQ